MAHQPQNLVATAISANAVTLSWDDVADLTGEVYDIERNGVIVGDDYAGTHTPAAPYTDTGLSADTDYTYRVRAVGGTEVAFSPPDIMPLDGWYDATQITPVADGTALSAWNDLSGNGKNLTQATSGSRPLYKTSIRNSLPIVRFDGIDDTMGDPVLGARTAQTMFIVATKRTAPSGGAVGGLFVRNWVNAGLYAYATHHATNWCWQTNQAGSFSQIGITANAWHILVLRLASASSMTFRAEGGAATATIDPHDDVTLASSVMRWGWLNGFGDDDVGELIFYGAALSNADLDKVGGYLATKWGFTWTPVS